MNAQALEYSRLILFHPEFAAAAPQTSGGLIPEVVRGLIPLEEGQEALDVQPLGYELVGLYEWWVKRVESSTD